MIHLTLLRPELYHFQETFFLLNLDNNSSQPYVELCYSHKLFLSGIMISHLPLLSICLDYYIPCSTTSLGPPSLWFLLSIPIHQQLPDFFYHQYRFFGPTDQLVFCKYLSLPFPPLHLSYTGILHLLKSIFTFWHKSPPYLIGSNSRPPAIPVHLSLFLKSSGGSLNTMFQASFLCVFYSII